MGNVVVVTDSSTCLPARLVESFDIQVLPISVHLPEGEPGTEFAVDALWELPEAIEEIAGANHPFVTEYLAAIEAPGHDAAVIITPAVEFASMYRNAALAAQLAERPTVTIDARTAAAGQALVVLAGAAAALDGADLDEVVRVVEDASRRVELVASLTTLEPMRRSGPVPEDVLGSAALTDTRSVFRMREGAVEPLGASAEAEETLEVIRAAFLDSGGKRAERVTVFHAGAPELAERLAERLGGVDFICGFSVAMQIYTGDGVVGAAWLPRTAS